MKNNDLLTLQTALDMSEKEQKLFTKVADALSDEQKKDLDSILHICDNDVTLKEKINIAFGVKENMYMVFHDAKNMYNVGVEYVKKQAPNLCQTIFENIDFENIATEHSTIDGAWAGDTYIYNFGEAPKEVYNGENADELLTELEQTETNTDRYVAYINQHILFDINYDLLQESYGTEDKLYAKFILKMLHTAAIEVYGISYFDGFDENEYVLLPGIVRGKEKGNICVALLEIDLQSSGEHWGTTFLTKYGCQPQFDEERPEEITKFLRETYGVYDYAYTIGIETDHHVDFDTLHTDIKEILNTFERSHLDVIAKISPTETEKMNGSEDLER